MIIERTPEEQAKIKEKIDQLKNSKFKQLEIPSWRPVPTLRSTVVSLILLGVFFMGIGSLLLSKSTEAIELAVQYDKYCN